MSRFQLGITEGAAVLLVAMMSAYSGIQSDRGYSRYRLTWIRIGYGLPMIARVLIALASNGWMLACGRLMDRFGKGLRGAPRDALLADCVESSQLGRAFGLHRAMDTAGALLGVLMATVLMQYLQVSHADASKEVGNAWQLRCIIWFGAALGAIAFTITWWLPSAPPKSNESNNEGGDTASPLKKDYWKFLSALVLFSLANSSDAFLLLRIADLGFTATGAVALYAVYNSIYAIASYPLGHLSDRIGRRRLIGMGWCIYALVYVVMGSLSKETNVWMWPTLGLYGFYMACTDGIGKAVIADLAPLRARGKAMGIFYFSTGIALLLANAIGGLLWDLVSPSVSLYTSAALALLATIAMILTQQKRA